MKFDAKKWVEKEVFPDIGTPRSLPRHYARPILSYEKSKEGGAELVLPWYTTPEYKGGSKQLLKLMAIQAASDISDLIVKGDVDSNGPLFRAMDGLEKMGVPKGALSKVCISDVGYTSTKEKGNTNHLMKMKLHLEVPE